MAESTLTPRQEKFLAKYLECGNASEAYRLSYNCAKSSDATINKEAAKLLRHPGIAPRIAAARSQLDEAIKQATDAAAAESGATREAVILELSRIAFGDLTRIASWGEDGKIKFIPSGDLEEKDRAILSEIRHELSPRGAESIIIKPADKLGALKALAQILGLTRDGGDGAGEGKLNLKINISKPDSPPAKLGKPKK